MSTTQLTALMKMNLFTQPIAKMKKLFSNWMGEEIRKLGEYINNHNDKYAEDLYYTLCAIHYKCFK